MAKEFNITRTAGTCIRCEKKLQPEERYTATLREQDEQFAREDYCLECWQQAGQTLGDDIVGIWQTQIPRPQEKKKLFVDNEVLMNFFRRLEGAEEPDRIAFRFVLTLILMRKRLLSYEGSRKDEQMGEIWSMKIRGTNETSDVVNPNLGEDQIAEVSSHLSEVLEGDL